ncbi:MAG TPA: hypothetical protein PLI68_13785, partial [Bacteroidia bacterium]|nr:hypothetical protein [Bacteroidia bacterium]
KAFKLTASICISLLIALFLLEISYRYYWIDFYRAEFNLLNSTFKKDTKKTILIFGDSFSASPDSYVKNLRDSFPQIEFVNAAVSGTGIQEVSVMLDYRVNQVNPSIVVYQVYVGNDLTDIEKPVNFKTVSFTRSVYWKLCNYLYSLRYLNYKAGQFSFLLGINKEQDKASSVDVFSALQFSPREKLYLQADSTLPASIIYLNEKYKHVQDKYIHELRYLNGYLKAKKIPLLLVIVPHCAQVNDHYANHFKEMGAVINEQYYQGTSDYPFYTLLKTELQSNSMAITANPLEKFRMRDTASYRLYFENDIHLTANGQSELAKYLVPLIKAPLNWPH